jgi:hypothetical protein
MKAVFQLRLALTGSSFEDPPTQIVTGLEQLVMLTRVTFLIRVDDPQRGSPGSSRARLHLPAHQNRQRLRDRGFHHRGLQETPLVNSEELVISSRVAQAISAFPPRAMWPRCARTRR